MWLLATGDNLIKPVAVAVAVAAAVSFYKATTTTTTNCIEGGGYHG